VVVSDIGASSGGHWLLCAFPTSMVHFEI